MRLLSPRWLLPQAPLSTRPHGQSVTAPKVRSPGSDSLPLQTRSAHVRGADIRTKVRSGTRPVPLLLVNGIGTSIEVLQPLVDALDPEIEVIRFDVSGVGGSSNASTPYRFSGMSHILGAVLDRLSDDRGRHPRPVLGRGARPAVRHTESQTVLSGDARQHRDGLAYGAGQCKGPRSDGDSPWASRRGSIESETPSRHLGAGSATLGRPGRNDLRCLRPGPPATGLRSR